MGHSVENLESMLGDRERYFQPMDRRAPGFTLQDARGRIHRLADYRGRAVILHFVYARCPDVCPLHAERIAEVQSLIGETPMKDRVRFITITTDPANDTKDVMRGYGPAHGLGAGNWVFLTKTGDQPEDATRAVAKAFGHKFTKVGDSYQVHGVVTHVIGPAGRWRANFHGLKFAPENLVLYVNGLLNTENRPHDHGDAGLWDRLMGGIRKLFR